MKRIIFYIYFIFIGLTAYCLAQEPWRFKQTYESGKLMDSPFFLNTAADLNGNGIKELILTDFGRFGDHMEEWKQWKKDYHLYDLMILEWENNELKIKWKKQWDMSKTRTDDEARKYFTAYEAMQMIELPVGNRVKVETIPPYLGLEWAKGQYELREQQGVAQELPQVGSWALPWLSASCYENFMNDATWKKMWPRECLLCIRDFSGKGKPNIVTVLEEKISETQYKQKVRVRKFEQAFAVEWEIESPKRFAWWTPAWWVYVDRLNWKANNGLLLFEFYRPQDIEALTPRSWSFLKLDEKGQGYKLIPVQAKGAMPVSNYDLPDVYLRTTQKKDAWEYWGYRPAKEKPQGPATLLRKVSLKPDFSDFVKEDIDFEPHKNFLGVGFFIVQDIDGDGLDEIILVEETGKKKFVGHESVEYSDIKDYIRILKWNGKEYQTMWISPPYTKRGTKFLVEDIKNTGKKQLVILSPYGTVQIWERQQ